MGGRWALTCCCILAVVSHECVLVGCSSSSSLSRHVRRAADEFPVSQRQLQLRGGGKSAIRTGKRRRSAAIEGHSNASSPPRSPAGDTGIASGLFEEMTRLLRTGEIPEVEALAPDAHGRAPKRGPGSRHRTPPLAGWAKNLGGNFGVELPEGGLAGGGLLPEPNRVKWATRLANSSDTCAHLGHKLVQLCDNVSLGIDPVTEKGPFYLDVPAALDCIDKVRAFLHSRFSIRPLRGAPELCQSLPCLRMPNFHSLYPQSSSPKISSLETIEVAHEALPFRANVCLRTHVYVYASVHAGCMCLVFRRLVWGGCMDFDMGVDRVQGADVNGRGPFDLSPLLMLCAADGHEMMIERLLDAGADVHAQDSAGNTPLHEAVRCRSQGDMRSIEVVKMLIEAGANVYQADIWNVTALDVAHSSLARHSWWSGVCSVEAAKAREIVGILGGNVNFGVEQVVLQEAKWQRRLDRERAKRDAKLERRAALLEEQRRARGLDHEYLPVD